MPAQIADGRLLGGLDLAATLVAGRPIAERGLLAEANGGVLVVPMAERIGGGAASFVGAALDTGEVVVERDGIALRAPARFAALLLDEGIDDERVPPALAERLAFAIDLNAIELRGGAAYGNAPAEDIPSNEAIATARGRLGAVVGGDEAVEALAAAGLLFGAPSLRLATLALRAAKAAAALAGRTRVMTEDAELAAALVIAPRATMVPPPDAETEPSADPEPPSDAPAEPPPAPQAEASSDPAPGEPTEAQTMADSVVEATRAAIPADLLAMLSGAAGLTRQGAAGRVGASRVSARRGRPAGTRRGVPGHGVRLAVVETLRAAAPWQKLRRLTAVGEAPKRILVRREDFRVGRFKQKSETVTIFVVDASGSAALHRLAEVKGAVELVLADCYARRDCVALIAFRGNGAELVLPPTRSLVRAKRTLAGLPGGGGTPLAAAIDAAATLADAARKKGQAPLVVLLTDGKANITRAGRSGRAEAEADVTLAARAFRLAGAPSLVLDIAPRPGEAAQRLSLAMGGRYIPLPYADAQVLSRTILAATPAA
jgi:magnesium chelatase subunit D